MKKTGVVVVAILCIALVCGCFYYVLDKNKKDENKNGELTTVQKVITKDLDKKYPATPREVVKVYNRIITCYYGEEYSDKEFDGLVDQAMKLFDNELLSQNSKSVYSSSVKKEISEYKELKKEISQSTVCASNDVKFVTDKKKNDNIAYVTSSYFVKTGGDYSRTYMQYVLREDEKGRWKILGYYQIEGASSDDE